MFNVIQSKLIQPSLIAYSLLASCLTLSSIAPIQAQTPENPQQIAQAQYDWNSQYSQNSQTYLVIVDNNDTRVLQQVRTVEPTAFFSRFQGRSVIQAGTFNSLSNAQERFRQLQRYGVTSRIYTENGAQVALPDYNSGSGSNSGTNNPRQKTKYYYVAIPEKPEKLTQISNQIRQGAGGNAVGITVRNSPRGPHVAVGPFAGRLQAEQWNYYIRSLGISEARVYYGK